MSAGSKDAFDRGASQRWSPRVRRRGRRERDWTAWLRAVAHHEISVRWAQRGRPHWAGQAVEWARPKVGQPLGRWEACELCIYPLNPAKVPLNGVRLARVGR